jgi:steroid delta-isomerase-like uncharacterized protein
MTETDLAALYRGYIECLNRQNWDNLGQFVGDDVVHNNRKLGLSGYRGMLENDYAQIPDLKFNIDLLSADPLTSLVASRLLFDCTPKGEFLGLPVNGKKISFSENVFYRFADGKIVEVWSLLDKQAVEAQL